MLTPVMDRMLAKDRSRRYATPGEVVETLAPFAVGGDLRALIAAAAAPGSIQPPTVADVSSPLAGTFASHSAVLATAVPSAPGQVGQSSIASQHRRLLR